MMANATSTTKKVSEKELEKLKDKLDKDLANGDASLQESIAQYKAAYEAEFEVAESENRNLAKTAEKEMFNNALTAAKVLNELAQHADKENVRADCAKFIITSTVGKVLKAAEKDNELEKLLERLGASDPA